MDNISEQYQFFSLQTLYSLQIEFIIRYGIVVLLMLIALYLLFPSIKRKICENNNNKVLKNLAKEQIKNVSIKISQDETVYIDHLLLLPTGILVLNVMKYNGIIFAGENVELWTQLLNKKSYKFPNPLRDLEVCESAVRGVLGDCNVFSHIVFESSCQFPKGKPDKISLLHELQDELEFHKDAKGKHPEQKWEEKWHYLKNSDICHYNIKQNNLSILVKGEQKSNFDVVGIIFFVLSLLLLVLIVFDVT